jgi:hypothetical protein
MLMPLAMLVSSACGNSKTESAIDAGDAAVVPDAALVLDGGGVPAVPPDGEELCASGECNYQSQSGCTAGQTCRPELAGGAVAPSCVAAGAGQLGETCNEWGDCGRGLFCAEGECRKLCCGGDWTACPNGQSCIRQLLVRDPSTNVTLDADVDLCFPVGTCDVLDPGSCAGESGRTCQIVDPVGNVACSPLGTALDGDACGPENPCGAQLSCVGEKCRKLCRAVESASDPGCATDEVCVHYLRDPPNVGECTPAD